MLYEVGASVILQTECCSQRHGIIEMHYVNERGVDVYLIYDNALSQYIELTDKDIVGYA